MGREEAADDGRDVELTELDRCRDRERAAQLGRGERRFERIELGERAPAALQVERAIVGERDGASRPVEEPRVQACLERGDRARDGLRRFSEPACSLREAALRGDRLEDPPLFDDSANRNSLVKNHPLFQIDTMATLSA
jgi:hypothetical protein